MGRALRLRPLEPPHIGVRDPQDAGHVHLSGEPEPEQAGVVHRIREVVIQEGRGLGRHERVAAPEHLGLPRRRGRREDRTDRAEEPGELGGEEPLVGPLEIFRWADRHHLPQPVDLDDIGHDPRGGREAQVRERDEGEQAHQGVGRELPVALALREIAEGIHELGTGGEEGVAARVGRRGALRVIRAPRAAEPFFDEPGEPQGDSCSNATHDGPQLSARRAWAIPKLACPESRWATTCGTRTAKTAKMSAPPRTSRSGLVGPKNVLD